MVHQQFLLRGNDQKILCLQAEEVPLLRPSGMVHQSSSRSGPDPLSANRGGPTSQAKRQMTRRSSVRQQRRSHFSGQAAWYITHFPGQAAMVHQQLLEAPPLRPSDMVHQLLM